MSAENNPDYPMDIETAKSRVLGDMELLGELLMEFEASLPAVISSIQSTAEARDAAALSRVSHQLKGAASNLSLIHIMAKAAALDDMGRRADFEETGSAVTALEETIFEFREFMRNRWPSIC